MRECMGPTNEYSRGTQEGLRRDLRRDSGGTQEGLRRDSGPQEGLRRDSGGTQEGLRSGRLTCDSGRLMVGQ